MTQTRRAAPSRRTLFDTLASGEDANAFCERKNLSNEASVETFFVNRLLEELGYRDSHIKNKHSIKELVVSLGGAKTANYKPDYVLEYRKRPRWVLDAKHPSEKLDKWVSQCSGYCLGLNQAFKGGINPVKWFVLTNGIETRVYDWDHDKPQLVLEFSDFVSGNPNYEKLRSLLGVLNLAEANPVDDSGFRFERPTSQQAKSL